MNKLLILITAVFLLSTASALEFDNVLSAGRTVNNYPELTVKNNFGLGGDIATMFIQENTDQCLTDCHSIINITTYEDGALPFNFNAVNKKGTAKSLLFNYYTQSIDKTDVQRTHYTESCKIVSDANSTREECTPVNDYNYTEEIVTYDWKKYKGDVVPAGNYLMKIEAKKQAGESIDWAFAYKGISVSQVREHWVWWNDLWGKKKPVYINGSWDNINTVNYSIRVNVQYDSDMNGDYSDIRFVNGSEDAELSYWIEYSNSSNAFAWVKVFNNGTIYMYYNNSAATNTSNIKTTFIHGDDFNDGSIDSLWNTQLAEGTASISEANGVISLNPVVDGQYVGINTNTSTGGNMKGILPFHNTSIVFKANIGISTAGDLKCIGYSNFNGLAVSSPYPCVGATQWDFIGMSGTSYGFRTYNGAGPTNAYGQPIANLSTIFELRRLAGNSTKRISVAGNFSMEINGNVTNTFVSQTATLPTIPLYWGLSNDDGNTDVMTVDYAFARPYMATEPVVWTGEEQAGASFQVTQIAPETNYITNSQNIYLSCNLTATSENLVNGTLWVWNSTSLYYRNLNDTLTGTNVTINWSLTNVPDNNYTWACYASSVSTSLYTANRTFMIDSTTPKVLLDKPLNGTTFFTNGSSYPITLNFSAWDTNLAKCWYRNTTGNYTINCGANATIYMLGGVHTLYAYANDTVGNEGNNQTTFKITTYSFSSNHSDTRISDENNTFIFNISATEITYLKVNLTYNKTDYPMTGSYNATAGTFTTSFSTPTVNQTTFINFTYTIHLNDQVIITRNYTQTVATWSIQLCDDAYTVPFINFTFRDEVSNTPLNGTFNPAVVTYSLNGTFTNKTYTVAEAIERNNYTYCFIPVHSSANAAFNITYSATGYPIRRNNYAGIITNFTTNRTLYLLSSTDGQYVTFQVVNSADQVLKGVHVTASRAIGGSTVLIEEGYTGESGSVTFWLNPDYVYDFEFTKTGYSDFTFSEAPAQTSYTITMGGDTVGLQNDTFRGIDYIIYPEPIFDLLNDTLYNFNFTLDSTFWTISSYGFALRLSNGTIVGYNSTTTEGNTVILWYNVNNQSIVYMDYFWVVNGQYTNATKFWVVSSTEYTQYSISNFFTDLKAYMNTGLFGIDDFGKYMIVFLIIFITSGVVSYKYGLTSPFAVTFIIFGAVFFFDVIVGLVPPIRGIEHLLTYITALALTIAIFTEVRK